MSFNRLNHDECTYRTNLKQSTGVGSYYTGKPRVNCQTCLPNDPRMHVKSQNMGPNDNGIAGVTCSDKPQVDVSNELLGLTRKASNCPTQKYVPCEESSFCKYQHPVVCKDIHSEDTRLSNPPCTLRGSGWNRWEWLCQDPQKDFEIPFDHNISYRLIAKDNHRPCLPTLINQSQALPPLNACNKMYQSHYMSLKPSVNNGDGHFPSVQWKKCDSFHV